MNKIKVIKKDVASRPDSLGKVVKEEKTPPKSKGRNAIKTVENWIAEWRIRTETETRRAMSELNNWKLKNSNGT